MTIHVIGAGPAGSYSAYLLAKAGNDVEVWERSGEVGTPVQCTGIVTNELKKFFPLKKEFVLNRLKKVQVNSLQRSVEIKNDDVVICRKCFDQFIADKAKKAGAHFNLEHEFAGMKDNLLIIKDIKNKKIKNIKFDKNDILIGADGPRSSVSQILDNKPLEFWTGIQARIKIKNNNEAYRVWFGKAAPEFFAWAVPESADVVRVGLAGKKNLNKLFNDLLNKFADAELIEKQGGIIPIYDPQLTVQKNNIFLVGDAAGQVKATTGGGIIPGLQAAECLVEAITTGKSYKALLNRKVNKNLKKHLLIRKMLNKFEDTDYDALLNAVDTPEVKELLSKDNRDQNPAKILTKLALTQPRLLKFAKMFFK